MLQTWVRLRQTSNSSAARNHILEQQTGASDGSRILNAKFCEKVTREFEQPDLKLEERKLAKPSASQQQPQRPLVRRSSRSEVLCPSVCHVR